MRTEKLKLIRKRVLGSNNKNLVEEGCNDEEQGVLGGKNEERSIERSNGKKELLV